MTLTYTRLPARNLDKSAGLLRPAAEPTPVRGRELVLEDALFEDDVVIFDPLTSRRLSYGAEAGPRLDIAFPDAACLGAWTRPGAPYICIEPWRGMAASGMRPMPVRFPSPPCRCRSRNWRKSWAEISSSAAHARSG